MNESTPPFLNFKQVEFLLSSPTLHQCPEDTGLEVAFAGRSNAGKSSALNTLTGNTKLARTSKTPGRTQLLNFFTLAENRRLVDLPGYGFAKVPKAMKQAWDQNLAEYLQMRQSLCGLVLLMDIRHPLQPHDWQMVEWSMNCDMPVHILLTKADKFKQGAAKNVLLKVSQQIKTVGFDHLVTVQTFSSLKKAGVGQLVTKLNEWLSYDSDEQDKC